MQVRDIDAKVAAINLEDAKKVGLDLSDSSSVSINGSVVDIEFIDEFSNDWRLPKIYLKAQAYLTTLKEPNLKSYIRLISNKFENFKRISSLTEVEELAYAKVAKFCDENNFGLDETIDEVIYGNVQSLEDLNINDLIDELNKKVEVYNNNVTEYQELVSNSEDDNELVADALAKCKISIISIYRDFSLIQAVIENSPFQSYNNNVYDNNCPFCHKTTSFIDKDKLIYVDGNTVYYRRPGVDPSEYTDDDIIYVLNDEEVAEMFGRNKPIQEEIVEEIETKEFVEDKEDSDINPHSFEKEQNNIPNYSEYEVEEQVDIPNYSEYEVEEQVEEEQMYDEPEEYEESTYEETENEVYDEQVDIPDYSEEQDESLLENNYDYEYSNYNTDSEYNNIKEPTTEFEKLLFYSNENTPVVVNFVSSQQENIIKKSTIVEWVGNEVRSETIRLTDVDNSVISDTLKINDAIDSSKQYTHGFEFENITKHFVDGLEDDNGNTRVVINDKHGNTISLTELFDNEKEDESSK